MYNTRYGRLLLEQDCGSVLRLFALIANNMAGMRWALPMDALPFKLIDGKVISHSITTHFYTCIRSMRESNNLAAIGNMTLVTTLTYSDIRKPTQPKGHCSSVFMWFI